jgi:uncharacterized protein
MDDFDKPAGEYNDIQSAPPGETYRIYAKISPLAAAFLGLFGGFILYQILGGSLILIFFGSDISDAPRNVVRLTTMAGQILFIMIPALILSKMVYDDVVEVIRFKVPQWTEILLFSLGIIILTPLLQYFLFIQNHFLVEWAKVSPFIESVKSLFDSLNEVVETAYANLLRADSIPEGLFVVVVVAVVPAITEEIMFRGYIQRSMEFRLKPIWAALITAFFFGLFHFNLYGLIPLISLGFYFGFAAYMSNSIIVPIVLHFINNFTAVMLFLIIGDEELIKSSPTSDPELGSSVFMFFVFLVLLMGVITLIKRYYSEKRNS